MPASQTVGFLDLGFTRFITSTIVKVLWLISLIAAGLGFIVGTLYILWILPVLQALVALVGLLIGCTFYTLMVRVMLEITVVIFRATEHLRDINARGERLTPH
jgi:xanthosine utilization system XapX-like protein